METQRAITFCPAFVKDIPKLRSILFCCAMPLLLASVSFAQGEYQQTRDNKTMIWNGTPKSGETSVWSGERDKENYGSGFGDLTWYNAKGNVYAVYYGNMVRGKFQGPVNVHSHGRTAHAYFVDGGRVTGWARGPAPSKMSVPEDLLMERRKAEGETAAVARKQETKPEPEKHVAAAAPEPAKKAKIEPEKVQRIASQPETKPEKAEITPAEKSAPEITPTVAMERSEVATTPSRSRAFDEPTAFPKVAPTETTPADPENAQRHESEGPLTESNQPSIQETPPAAQKPASEEKTEVARESSAAPATRPTPPDVSVNALVGPPPSLRTTSTPEMSPEKPKTRSLASENAPLTETEAVDLADSEARIQGYQPDDYERPTVDYSRVQGKWSLFYSLKKGEAGTGKPATFTMTVEDKTRKVEIKN